ncbi:MAG: alpha/beta fold hydrolase [Planctomycetes bacterium]|nr:alpha/beta fold hydrolase [Planctomycetota bacterium]
MTADTALLPPGATCRGEIMAFSGSGGRVLRCRVVRARQEKRLFLYFHGIESHGGWFLPAAARFAERGVSTCLMDRRGSGLNREEEPGDAPSAEVLLEDVRRLRRALGDPPLSLVGLSWGGKLALAAALDRPRAVKSVILITPGLKPRVDLGAADKLRLLLSLCAGGRRLLPVPIEPEMFTVEPALLDYIRNDPWRLHRVTARFLLAGVRLDRQIARALHSLAAPVLLFLATRDRIIDNARTEALLAALPPGRLAMRVYDATHSIQLEQTERMVEDVVSFLDGLEEAP